MYCADSDGGGDGAPDSDGDLEMTVCCMAITPECLACAAGMSVDDYNAMQAGSNEAMIEQIDDPFLAFSLPDEVLL